MIFLGSFLCLFFVRGVKVVDATIISWCVLGKIKWLLFRADIRSVGLVVFGLSTAEKGIVMLGFRRLQGLIFNIFGEDLAWVLLLEFFLSLSEDVVLWRALLGHSLRLDPVIKVLDHLLLSILVVRSRDVVVRHSACGVFRIACIRLWLDALSA